MDPAIHKNTPLVFSSKFQFLSTSISLKILYYKNQTLIRTTLMKEKLNTCDTIGNGEGHLGKLKKMGPRVC